MSNPKPQQEVTLVCDLSALSNEQREHHNAVAQELFSAISGVRELADGYALQFPDEPQMILKIADFISDERLCCSFIAFGIEIEAERGKRRYELSVLRMTAIF